MKKVLFTDATCKEDSCHDLIIEWVSPTQVTAICAKCIFIKDMDLTKEVEVTDEF